MRATPLHALIVKRSDRHQKQARLLDVRVTQAVVPDSSRYEQSL